MRHQGGQSLYRGGENKKEKPTKMEKAYIFAQKEQLRITALKTKNNKTIQ